MAKKTKKTTPDRFEWPFGPKNYLIFLIGLLVIIVGYITLGYGSITLAPILLILGYCVMIPAAILVKGKKKAEPLENIDVGK